MRRYKILIFILVLVLAFTGGVLADTLVKEVKAQLRGDFKIFVDNDKQTFKDEKNNIVYPLLYNGTTYLPVRAMSNLFNKEVYWDDNTNSIYLGEFGTEIKEFSKQKLSEIYKDCYQEDGALHKMDLTKSDYDKEVFVIDSNNSITYPLLYNGKPIIYDLKLQTNGEYNCGSLFYKYASKVYTVQEYNAHLGQYINVESTSNPIDKIQVIYKSTKYDDKKIVAVKFPLKPVVNNTTENRLIHTNEVCFKSPSIQFDTSTYDILEEDTEQIVIYYNSEPLFVISAELLK